MTFKEAFLESLNGVPLSAHEKLIIRRRYVDIVTTAESHQYWTSVWYYVLVMTVTISGAMIVSFSSFDLISNSLNTVKIAFIWTVWALSMILMLANGFMHAFNVPKKYVLGIVVVEKLKSEGWAFIAGIGRYRECQDTETRFLAFCTRIEKIKQKSLEAIPEMESADPASDILATGGEYETPTGEPAWQPSSRSRSKVAFGHLANKIALKIKDPVEAQRIIATISEIIDDDFAHSTDEDDPINDPINDNIADIAITFDHDDSLLNRQEEQ